MRRLIDDRHVRTGGTAFARAFRCSGSDSPQGVPLTRTERMDSVHLVWPPPLRSRAGLGASRNT